MEGRRRLKSKTQAFGSQDAGGPRRDFHGAVEGAHRFPAVGHTKQGQGGHVANRRASSAWGMEPRLGPHGIGAMVREKVGVHGSREEVCLEGKVVDRRSQGSK